MKKMREYVREGITFEDRMESLKSLKREILDSREDIERALKADLGKSAFESGFAEILITIEEINHTLKNLKKWMKPTRVSTPFIHYKSSSYRYFSPLGLVLILSPWNYPFNLTFVSLIGAIAAGNSIVIKASSKSFHTSELMKSIINNVFDDKHVLFLEGSKENNELIMKEKFDHIFFTGGTAAGKEFYEKAARDLTPVTLELGGKSPCIVDEDVNLKITAKRIVWGKLLNAGQTCLAPDFVLAHENIAYELLREITIAIEEFFGSNPLGSSDYPKIINRDQFDGLMGLIKEEGISAQINEDTLQIAPVVLITDKSSPLMREELFGPILPIIKYSSINEEIEFLKSQPSPLALYIFSQDKGLIEKVISEVSFGGATVNDTITHFANLNLGFGGVGFSGMGRYHGKYSFRTFSNEKSILKKSFFPDIKLRYPPFKDKEKYLKFLIK